MNLSSRKKFIFPLAVLLFFSITGLGIFFYINRLMETQVTLTDIQVDKEIALKLDVLEQISKKNGITDWELKAASATLMKKENQAVLKEVQVVFHTRNNTQVLLTSEEGILNTATHDITFMKNVQVHYETYTLRTDKLHYEKKAHIIHSEVPVRLENKESVLEADTMTTELNTNKTILEGHVKGTFSEKITLP